MHFLLEYYGVAVKPVYDEALYLVHPDAQKINYSYHRLLPDEVWIHPHVLLFESTVRPVKMECFQRNGNVAFFRTEGDTGFDLFAALFFLLTRYEEYLPHKPDGYGRYAHENSVAFKEGFLRLPLVNIWLEDFRKLLGRKFPGVELPTRTFSFQPTYDIDMVWSYRHKGFKRTAGALVRQLVRGAWRSVAGRIAVILGKRQDPFDAYGWMNDLHRRYNLHPLYFFLVAQRVGQYDKNIDPAHPAFEAFVKRTASQYAMGLHPSWTSGDHPSLLKTEKGWLERTTGKPVTASRQHYIRFQLPTTYRRLIEAGITDDWSMGYGSVNGFRASVTTPFWWYDLKEEKQTALRVHPFCFMDANACYEERKSAGEALEEMRGYYRAVRDIDGTMTFIWHNSFLGTDAAFAGWREVYEEFVREVS